MSSRIVTSVLLAFVAYFIYSWYSTQVEGFDVNSQQYERPPQSLPILPSEPKLVNPSGPNPPAQLSLEPPVIMQEEKPFDPQEQPHESAEIPERLRHPERMFGPGLANEDVETAVAAGTAHYASHVTENAAQVFGPEFAQNGGNFMDGIMANDASLKSSYSSV